MELNLHHKKPEVRIILKLKKRKQHPLKKVIAFRSDMCPSGVKYPGN
jgi:hypothetical protein